MSTLHYLGVRDLSSDNQTITPAQTIQQPIVTLEYLLNQNKMKEIALSKATHLIELYKIQLQVKQKDFNKELEYLKKTEKDNYSSLIESLENKILQLERQIKIYEQKIKDLEKQFMQNLQSQKLTQSGCRAPKISRNNSGKDLSNNRKVRCSQTKNISGVQQNLMRKNSSSFFMQEGVKQQDLYRIEKSFLLRYILKSEQKDEKLINTLENGLDEQGQYLNEIKTELKANDRLMDQLIRDLKQPFTELQSKMRQYKEIIKIQELIIQEQNGQLEEHKDLFQVMNSSLIEIYEAEVDSNVNNQTHRIPPFNYSQINPLNQIQFYSFVESNQLGNQTFDHFRSTLDHTHSMITKRLKQFKSFIKQKINGMEQENKELKRILDDMIKLIKDQKKMPVNHHLQIKNLSQSSTNFKEVQSYKILSHKGLKR